MTLRYLAGGNVWDIVDMHGVSPAAFYKYLWLTVEAINNLVRLPGLPIRHPEKFQQLSDGFYSLNGSTMAGCIGAIDGIAIEIMKPSPWDSPYPKQYMNRKHFFSINCQAICDADLRFTWCSLQCSGGIHDSLAWQATSLYEQLDNMELPEGYWLVGDGAYDCRPWMIVLFPGRTLTKTRSDFNFYQSRTMITIERAFGVLTARWGILRRQMTCSLQHARATVQCCMRLHNICIYNPEFDPIRKGKEKEVQDDVDRFRLVRQSDGLAVALTAAQRKGRNRAVDVSVREELCERLHDMGCSRPHTSRYGQGHANLQKRMKRNP